MRILLHVCCGPCAIFPVNQNMHIDKCELVKKLIGHYAYYGVTGNLRKMVMFKWYLTEGVKRR